MEQPKGFISKDQNDWSKKTKPITLEMQKGVWEIFKEIIPRSKTLNDAIVNLIIKEINENSEIVDDKDFQKFLKEQEFYSKNRKKERIIRRLKNEKITKTNREERKRT